MPRSRIAEAYVQVVPRIDGVGSSLRTQLSAEMASAGEVAGAPMARGLATGFGSKIKGYLAPVAATMAASFAAIGVVEGIKTAISSASDFAEQGTAVGQVFGKAADDIQAFAAGGATALGQSKVQVLEAAKSFGIYGKAAGLAGADNASFSKDLVGLATDLASFNNTSVDEAIQALGSGLRGEAEPLRKYGILLNDADLRQQALKMGLIKTTKEALSPQNKVLAANALIFEQTKTQQGDFGRTSEGLANQQRILSAQMANVGITVGTALLPAITSIVKFFNENMVPAFDGVVGWFKTWGEALVIGAGVVTAIFVPAIVIGTAKAIASFVTMAIEAIKNTAIMVAQSYKTIGSWVMMGISATVNAAKTVAGWVVSAAGAIANAAIMVAQGLRVVGSWVLMGAQSLIQAARMAAAWFIALGPVGWVIAAVVALAVLIIANWDKISAFTAKAWKAITSWISQAWNNIVTAVSTGVNNVINWFKELPNRIMTALGNLGTLLLTAGKNIIDGLLKGLQNAAAGALNFVKDLGANIAKTFKDMLGIKSPSKVFREFGKNIMDGLKEGLTGEESSVKATMKKVSEWVSDAFYNKDITLKAAQAANALVKVYSSRLSMLAANHDAIVKQLSDAQDRLGEKLKEKADFIQAIASKFGASNLLDENSTAKSVMESLQARIKKAAELKAVTDQLINMGLNKELYKQIVEAGAVDFAKSIIEGGVEAVSQLNVLADQASAQAQELAQRTGAILFDEGIKFAQAVVDGLKSQEATIAAMLSSLAAQFGAQLSAIIQQGAAEQEAINAAADKAKTATKTTSKTATKAPVKTVAKTTATKSVVKAVTSAASLAARMAVGKGIPKFASGGFVNGPTLGLIGEAGPEVVTPLKDFERMMGVNDNGAPSVNYYAAPNNSLDSEQALLQAIKRAKVVGSW